MMKSSPVLVPSFIDRRLAAAGLAAICLTILPTLLLLPMCGDPDHYQAMAFELLNHHALPYLGSWDMNFPGIVYLHAACISIFGSSMLAFRFFELCWQVLTVLALYYTSRLWLTRFTSLLGCLFYALFYIAGPVLILGQRDAFVVLPIILSIMCFVRSFRAGGHAWAMSGGLLVAMATWIRPTYGLLMVPAVATILSPFERRNGLLTLAAIAGFLSMMLIGVVPFALEPNGLREFYLATVRFGIDVYAPQSHFEEIVAKRSLGAIVLFVTLVASMFVGRSQSARDLIASPIERRFILGTLLALLLGVFLMRKLASYHWTPLYSLMMPMLASRIMTLVNLKRLWRTALVCGTTIVLFAAFYPWKVVITYLNGRCSLESAYAASDPDREYGYRADEATARYLMDHTTARDRVEIVGVGIRWRVEREEATRFTSLTPVIMTSNGFFTDYQKMWRAEYIQNLKDKQPKFLAVVNRHMESEPISYLGYFRSIPGVSELLDRDYSLDTTIGGVLCFRRITKSYK